MDSIVTIVSSGETCNVNGKASIMVSSAFIYFNNALFGREISYTVNFRSIKIIDKKCIDFCYKGYPWYILTKMKSKDDKAISKIIDKQ